MDAVCHEEMHRERDKDRGRAMSEGLRLCENHLVKVTLEIIL